MKTTHITLALLGSLCLLSACKEQPAPAKIGSPALQQVFSTAPTGEAVSIGQARAAAKPGASLTLQGQVIGNIKPFVDGRSAFILGDPGKLTACNAKPGDSCPTPWDTCCDTPEDIKANTATIQVVDPEGRVLKESIESVGGLNTLSKIIVSGQVAPSSTSEVLVLNAAAIQVLE